MRALVVSDIHGNLQALDAVLRVARSRTGGGFDQLWNLGDVVGYGARPNEVIDTLRTLETQRSIHVRGNHDRVCCGLSSSQGFNPIAAAAAGWTRQNLRSDNREWLRELPMGPVQATVRALCAHGSPLHEDQYIASMRDAWTPLQRMTSELAFFGHTHLQGGFSRCEEDWAEDYPEYDPDNSEGVEQYTMDVPLGSRHLINPGAVGQPRDGDWRAAFAIYDETLARVTFFRTPYDVAESQTAIRDAHLPERLAVRLSAGR